MLNGGGGDRVEELNDRIASRSFPSCTVAPKRTSVDHFTFASVPTRGTLFPAVLQRRRAIDGDDAADGSSFASKVDVEMNLRNQYFALQRGVVDQSCYVPPSSSDMYTSSSFRGAPVPGILGEISSPSSSSGSATSGSAASSSSPPPSPVRLHNHTRTQLRNFL